MIGDPAILLPNPPPQYSPMKTTRSGSTPAMRATLPRVRSVLWVDPCRNSLPFCQYAMQLRGSMGWWVTDWWTMVSSTTTSASAKPASMSPTLQSSGASPIGSRSVPASSKTAVGHLSLDASPLPATFASTCASGPPSRRLSSGSSTNGSGSRSTRMASTAAAAVVSSTAATARIGSPSYLGSSVSAASRIPSDRMGRSSARRMPSTPSIRSAARVSTLRTRACGIGLSRSFAKIIPSARKSSAYRARPVIFALRSGGEMSVPITFSAISIRLSRRPGCANGRIRQAPLPDSRVHARERDSSAARMAVFRILS